MEQRTPATSSETTSTATPRVSKYTYNFSGALIEEEYPSGRKVKADYGSNGDLHRIYGNAGSNAPEQVYATNFSHNAVGAVTQMKLGNGKWETAHFNERNQVIQFGLGTSATNAGLWKTEYQYGELESGSVSTTKNTGNVAKQTLTLPGTSFTQSYKYDALFRLVEAKEFTGTSMTPNWTQAFGYDVYGNRTSFSQNIGGVSSNTTPAVDSGTNRFTSSSFTYDKNGNITVDVDPITAQSRSFIFNAENRQIEVKDTNGNWIGRYFYDGEGKRVKKVTNSETTIFVYSHEKLIAEYSTQISASPTIAYISTDHLGSPRIITDKFGSVKSRRDFMPFGEDVFAGVGGRTGDSGQKYSSSQDDIRQKFTGYQKDNETSLDFAEARMYENRHGRFTAIDPLLASGRVANPQTYNRYIYVGNNPIMVTDPSGLDWYFNEKENHYQWFDDKPAGDDWKPVFGTLSVSPYHFVDSANNGPVYLYQYDDRQMSPTEYREHTIFRASLDRTRSHAGTYFGGGAKGAGNFFLGIINSPVDTPIISFIPGTSLNSMFGTPRFVDYYQYNSVGESIVGNTATFTTGVLSGMAVNAAPAAFTNVAARIHAFRVRAGHDFAAHPNAVVAFGFDVKNFRISARLSGTPKIDDIDIHPSMFKLIDEAKANGMSGHGGPRVHSEFKVVNDLLNMGGERGNIFFKVIDLKTLGSKPTCGWCVHTTRGTIGL